MSNPYGLSDSGFGLYSGVVGIFGADNVTVTSGSRTAAHNATIPGASNTSQHIGGNAIDFTVKGYTSEQVAEIVGSSGMQYGQLIGYTGDNHVHIGTGNKGQDLLKVGKNYVTTSWKKAKNGILNGIAGKKAQDVAVTAAATYANTVLPGSGAVVEGVAGALGLGGDDCGWFCQVKKWFACSEPGDNCFFQRAGLVILALLLIGAAFYLFGSGQIQKLVKGS